MMGCFDGVCCAEEARVFEAEGPEWEKIWECKHTGHSWELPVGQAGCCVMLRVGDQAGSSVWRPWMPGQGVQTWLHGWRGTYRRFLGQNRTPHTNHFQGQKSPDLWDLLFLSISSPQFHPSDHLSMGKVPTHLSDHITPLKTFHWLPPSMGSHPDNTAAVWCSGIQYGG